MTLKVASGSSTQANVMTLNGAGNVGIGTSSPAALLSLYRAADASININTAATGTFPIKSGISFGAATTSLGGDNKYLGGAGIQGVNIMQSDNVTDLLFWTTSGGSPSEKVRILSTGGLTFNGDTAAANALNDYEEGTFTATLVPSTSGSISLFSTFRTLSYTKIGRQVTVKGLLLVQSVSSPVGTEVKIQGLPFLTANAGSGRGSGSVFVAGNSFNSAVYHGQNVSEISVIYNASTVSAAANSDWYVTFTYFV
jgi:hypothetical protein